MSDETEENEVFSLADFADLDVSEIQEVRFEQIPAGSYMFEVVEADLYEDEKDGETRFRAEFSLKITEVKAVLEAGVDKESLVGKTQTEKFFVNPGDEPENVKKSIGRIRAFVTDIGQDSSGKLGVIVRNAKGHTFGPAKIVKQPDRNDKSVKYARLQLESKAKR